jgi:hypothetical protein
VSSSIFSSSQPPEGRKWGRFLLGVFGFTLLILVGMELFLRAHGFLPSRDESPEQWALSRAAADHLGPDGIALVGTSRLLLDIQPDLFSEILGRPVEQLAIKGGDPFVILEDLANDTKFRGSVICEVLPTRSFGVPENPPGERAAQFVNAFRRRAWSAGLETRMRGFFQGSFSFLLQEVSLRKIGIEFLTHGTRPVPNGERGFGGRFRAADFTVMNAENGMKYFTDLFEHDREIPSEAELALRLQHIEGWVRRIQSRGGRVVFVRMISSGSVRAVEDRRFSRAKYWDRLVASTSAGALYFEDSESLRSFSCPDGSHLDYRDTVAFTRAFATELTRKALIQKP